MLPATAGIGLSFLVERLLQPGTSSLWKRTSRALAIHSGIWLLFFTFELALFRRPWFAAVIVAFFLLVVVLVSNAKFHFLREPFIFQDFEYFTDALKHPRLYLPFFGLSKVLLACAGFGAVLFAGVSLEPALTREVPSSVFWIMVAALVIAALTLLRLGTKKKLPVTFEPETDLQQLGLLASVWRYGEEERKRCRIASPYDLMRTPDRKVSEPLPDLVVVQSESFFDPRSVFPGVCAEVLQEYDAIRASSALHGKIKVPAWGANTVRTEFAFLAGLGTKELGVHRFNPYRKLAHQGIPTLAGYLKHLGYRTVCVHPYPASFYRRNEVFPLLGFDQFIDLRAFDPAQKFGPYIGDTALAAKICALLGTASTQPIFVFAITMENHGPLHWEKVLPGEVERLYSSPPPDGCDDLTIYLRHLCNADHMAGMLRSRMEALPRAQWLCWFGDHVPIMPTVYRVMGAPDGRTDYLLWEKGGADHIPGKGTRLDLQVEDLGCLLLEKMGLISTLNTDETGHRPSQAAV